MCTFSVFEYTPCTVTFLISQFMVESDVVKAKPALKVVIPSYGFNVSPSE